MGVDFYNNMEYFEVILKFRGVSTSGGFFPDSCSYAPIDKRLRWSLGRGKNSKFQNEET